VTRIETAADQDHLAASVANSVLSVLIDRQLSRLDPVLALTGGSMGVATLAAMKVHSHRNLVNWSRVTLIWGDERWLRVNDADRNEVQANAALLDAVSIDGTKVHRVDALGTGYTLDQAAARYSAVVDSLPRIDLALFGVGPDGHIASLFPGRDDLLSRGPGVPSVLAVRNSPKAPAERVSLSLDAICRADRVWLLAAGHGKAEAIGHVRSPGLFPLPAARITGRRETVLWADAAALGKA
jgi:6-phosphogluconolactonase